MDQPSHRNASVGEITGTAVLTLLGAGRCGTVTLRLSRAKADGTRWIVVASGGGSGVLAGAYTVGPRSGGHLNPAVTPGSASNPARGLGPRLAHAPLPVPTAVTPPTAALRTARPTALTRGVVTP